MVKHSRHPALRSALREIRGSLGRFLAILIITALGVGFFAGLRLTEPSMTETARQYLAEHRFHDYRLLSTLGFDAEDVAAFDALDGIHAVGAYRTDLSVTDEEGKEAVFRAHSLTDGINTPSLTDGAMPQNPGECLIDSHLAERFPLGSTLTVGEGAEGLSQTTLTVVGHMDSPLYLNFERGNTTLGSGSLAGFVFLLPEAFSAGAFYEMYLAAALDAEAYTDAYTAAWEALLPTVEATLAARATARRDALREEALAEIAAQETALAAGEAAYAVRLADYEAAVAAGLLFGEAQLAAEAELTAARAALEESRGALTAARTEAESLPLPTTYVLGREDNTGYACFESDSAIVSAISVVFPLLFLLVAILVCMTTMTRMVDEERTQIGTLKSLGYTEGQIQLRFQLYAGLASLLGWGIGYTLGALTVPRIIWAVYDIMYGFAPLTVVFSLPLFLLCLAASLGCGCGAAFFACRATLRETPAALVRPKAPKEGKKVFLERIPWLWRRLKFLHKVSARNIFRYGNRLFMMLVGIGGCTALLVTGFGINDSIKNIADFQFGEIMCYDYAVGLGDAPEETLDRLLAVEGITGGASAYSGALTAAGEDGSLTAYVLSSSDPAFSDYVRLHDGKTAVTYPDRGQVVVSRDTAEQLGLKVGDTLTLKSDDLHAAGFTVSGIFDNFIYHYTILSPEDLASLYGEIPADNVAYLGCAEGQDVYDLGATLGKVEGVTTLTVTQDLLERVGGSLESIKGIVVFVVVCAATLAFVVLYNLSNINIAERVREIATIKVLGFYRREVSAYIFREIAVLTAMGAVVGLPLGKLLHAFVMGQIKVDQVHFENRVSWLSYVIAFAMTVLFALLVNLFMSRRLEKIDMSGSLKSVE